MKLAVSSMGKDLDSQIDPRFGRCSCFGLLDELITYTSYMKIKYTVAFLLTGFLLFGQEDQEMIKNMFHTSLSNGLSYAWLDHLSNNIGGRLSGSENAQKAVEYTQAELVKLGLDKVWLQPVMVPKWVRGEKETGYYSSQGKKYDLNICALGGSVATPAEGITGSIIEVQGLDELKALGEEKVKGNIIFFNRPMEETLIHTFEAYGGCVDQRYSGAMEAGKLGAIGVVVRSMNLRMDDLPHTGSMTYGELPDDQRIPSAAISTNDAEKLSKQLKKIQKLVNRLTSTIQYLKKSYSLTSKKNGKQVLKIFVLKMLGH